MMGLVPQQKDVDERGSFAYAWCEHCGWEGPARRSRGRARKDLDAHLEDKPKHARSVEVAEVKPVAEASSKKEAKQLKRLRKRFRKA